MRRKNKDQLRALLFKQAKDLRDEAIKDSGQLSSEQIKNLERLERLVVIYDIAKGDSPRKRWPMVALLVGTLIIVSLLLLARVSETDIELNVVSSGIFFDLPTQQVLSETIKLSSLGISGLKGVYIPRAQGQDGQSSRNSTDSGLAINLSVESRHETKGTITFSPLVLPAKTSLELIPMKIPSEYRISFKYPDLIFRANVTGPIRIGQTGAKQKKLLFSSPRSIILKTGAQLVDVNLTFQENSVQIILFHK